MAKDKITIMNIRNLPKDEALLFKSKAALADLTIQGAVLLLMRAVNDGRLNLKNL